MLALAAQVPGGAYFTKWIIAVDEDVDPTDMDQVIWAMATRCNPVDDIDLLRNTWSTSLDPAQNPPEKRLYGSKAMINACKDHRHLSTFSRRTMLRKSVSTTGWRPGGPSWDCRAVRRPCWRSSPMTKQREAAEHAGRMPQTPHADC